MFRDLEKQWVLPKLKLAGGGNPPNVLDIISFDSCFHMPYAVYELPYVVVKYKLRNMTVLKKIIIKNCEKEKKWNFCQEGRISWSSHCGFRLSSPYVTGGVHFQDTKCHYFDCWHEANRVIFIDETLSSHPDALSVHHTVVSRAGRWALVTFPFHNLWKQKILKFVGHQSNFKIVSRKAIVWSVK